MKTKGVKSPADCLKGAKAVGGWRGSKRPAGRRTGRQRDKWQTGNGRNPPGDPASLPPGSIEYDQSTAGISREWHRGLRGQSRSLRTWIQDLTLGKFQEAIRRKRRVLISQIKKHAVFQHGSKNPPRVAGSISFGHVADDDDFERRPEARQDSTEAIVGMEPAFMTARWITLFWLVMMTQPESARLQTFNLVFCILDGLLQLLDVRGFVGLLDGSLELKSQA